MSRPSARRPAFPDTIACTARFPSASGFPGATGNRFEHNTMHGNGRSAGASFPGADARELNPLVGGMLRNVWAGNDCDTDIPAGMICGVE